MHGVHARLACVRGSPRKKLNANAQPRKTAKQQLSMREQVRYRRYGMKFVEGIECRYNKTISGVNFTEARWKKKVSDARKSIISGHSSFSFYCAVFLTLYLGARLINLKAKEKFIGTQRRGSLPAFILLISKALRPFIQFGLLATAFFICLSRVSDYKHHPEVIIFLYFIFASTCGQSLHRKLS